MNYLVLKGLVFLDDFEVSSSLRCFAFWRGFNLSNNGGKLKFLHNFFSIQIIPFKPDK